MSYTSDDAAISLIDINTGLPIGITGSRLQTESISLTHDASGSQIYSVSSSLRTFSNIEQTPSGSLPKHLGIIGGFNLKNNRVMPVRVDEHGFLICKESEGEATFSAIVTDVAIGNNKSMISITNTSPNTVIKIREIFITNSRTTAITGIMAMFEMRRITSHSGGTLVTAQTHDTIDVLTSSVTVRTGATIVGESTNLFDRFQWSSDEFGTGTNDVESNDHPHVTLFPNWSTPAGNVKPLTLRTNEGLTVKQSVNSTNGNFDLTIIFTQEDN